MSNHDPNQDPDLEKLIQAICWKLGLENDSDDLKERWQKFEVSPNYQDKIKKIIKNLTDICADICKEVCEIKFDIIDRNLPNDEVAKPDDTLVNISRIFQNIDTEKIKERFKTAISKALEKKSPQLPPLSQSKKTIEDIRENATSSTPSITEAKTVGSANSPTPEAPLSEHPTDGNIAQPESTSIPITPPWQYHRIPDKDKEPEPHDEFYSKSDQPPEELKLIGARVRGKMHKHQGTNCDDWFEFDTVGKWTIIAVSDGAGSKKFSRIGAKISCQEAVKSLKNSLKSFSLDSRQIKTDLENDLSRQGGMFEGKDVKELQNFVYGALNEAYKAVENKASYLKNYPPYNKASGKKELDTKDLSATLLLAIHTTIRVERENSSYDFVLTCQIGDGMLAAISHEYTLKLLGKPDIGEHGGQTDFLTSDRKLETSNLVQKTFPFIGNLKALMIMTDGVSDDYFPNYPGMFELYGDLILNQVINFPGIDSKEREKQLQSTNLKTQDDVRNIPENFQDEVERILASDSEEPKKVSIRSIAKYAEQLGKDIKEVLTSPDLLNAGILTKQMCPECDKMESYEKLKIWLDSYYRRGSFDDRTLVVLYREEN